MSADDLDSLMHRLAPPVEVPPERAARVMEAVMARLDHVERAGSRHGAVFGWLAHLLPVTRFAMPMAAAALLGMVVGQGLRPADQAVPIDLVLTATYYGGLGE